MPDPTPQPSSAAAVAPSTGKLYKTYRGRSGHLAVMAEFLYREINVAIPEVDAGDDVFVVRDEDEAVTRVQVKTAAAEAQQSGNYVAQFNVPWDQLDAEDTPTLVYVFAVRYRGSLVRLHRDPPIDPATTSSRSRRRVCHQERSEGCHRPDATTCLCGGRRLGKKGLPLSNIPKRLHALAPSPTE